MNAAQLLLRIKTAKAKARQVVTAPFTSPGTRVDRNSEEAWRDPDDEHRPVGVSGILSATTKLLRVNRGEDEPDDRESLAWKRAVTPDARLKERITMDSEKTARQLMKHLARRKSLDAVSPYAFNAYGEGLFQGTPLAAPSEEINPMMLAEAARRITQMGAGGIGSDNAITMEMQAVNPSEFGFISPVEGPESSRAGIDNRLAFGTMIGSDGRIYQKMRNTHTGQVEWVTPRELITKRVAPPP